MKNAKVVRDHRTEEEKAAVKSWREARPSRLFRQLIETPATDMTGIAFQLAAGQVWEGSGASLRDDAAAAYPSAMKASGSWSLALA